MITKDYPLSELTGKIIGCAMEVHRHLGNGFQEVVYQRALSIELRLQKIPYEREMEMPLSYKGYSVGTRRVDFFIDSKVMVELKAVKELEDVHLAQGINYSEAYGLDVGLLIDLGARSLQFKRVMKPGRPSPNHSPSNHSPSKNHFES